MNNVKISYSFTQSNANEDPATPTAKEFSF